MIKFQSKTFKIQNMKDYARTSITQQNNNFICQKRSLGDFHENSIIKKDYTSKL